LRRSSQQLFRSASGEATLFFEQLRFHRFAFEHKGQEHGFAGTMFVRWQPGEAVAPVHEFFDGELQRNVDCRLPAAVVTCSEKSR